MNIMDLFKQLEKLDRIERKLDNDLTEVKILFENGQLSYHYFLDKNRYMHGEYKSWLRNGTLFEHFFYKNGKEIKNYLKEK